MTEETNFIDAIADILLAADARRLAAQEPDEEQDSEPIQEAA